MGSGGHRHDLSNDADNRLEGSTTYSVGNTLAIAFVVPVLEFTLKQFTEQRLCRVHCHW